MSNAIAELMTAGQLQMVSYTDGTTYKYRCFSIPGTRLASPNWHVRREKIDGSETLFPIDPNSSLASVDFIFAATSLEVVAAYSFTLPE